MRCSSGHFLLLLLLIPAEVRAERDDDHVGRRSKPAADPARTAPGEPKKTLTLDAAVFDLSDTSDLQLPVCFSVPTKLQGKRRQKLTEVMKKAALAMRPEHTKLEVKELDPRPPKKPPATPECGVLVTIEPKAAKGKTTDVDAVISRAGSTLERVLLAFDLDQPTEAEVAPAWRAAWAHAAPLPPPPKVEPPKDTTPFVDQELVEERRAEVPPPEPRHRRLSLFVEAGFASRSVSGAPGAAIDGAGLLSLGGSATLHAAGLLAIDARHDLDLSVGYARRLAHAELSGRAVRVDVDRFDVELAWRLVLGESLPHLGLLAGFEALRFVVDPSADVFSARYAALRGGLSVRQPIVPELILALDGALRFDPGTSSAGFDVGGGLELTLADVVALRVLARYADARGDFAGAAFDDGTFDLTFGLGARL